jgi:GT2 family glycosyltransferase
MNYIMRTSLIIPSLNAITLPATLTAVAGQSRVPDEIIVVGRDDAGSLAAFPDVRFVDTKVPVCAAKARNLGMQASSGDLFLFLDADCIPQPNWLEIHLQKQASGEVVVGGSVALHGSNYWAQSDNVSMFHDFVPQQPAGYRFLLPTLNLSVHRAIFEQVGGMDESFPGAAAEDADWTVRMRLAGFKLFFEPRATIQHAPTRTTWADVVRHWRNLGHNAVRVRLRYADEFGTPHGARNAAWWRWLSPLIAARVTAGIFINPIFWRYLNSLPIVYATKVIYCLGAADSVASGFAFQGS